MIPSHAPLRFVAPVTFRLLVANITVFLVYTLLGTNDAALFTAWGLVPGRFISEFGLGEVMTLITSMFLHAGWLHLLGNMVFLYAFGKLVEPLLGSRSMGVLYVLSGLGAALAQMVVEPASAVPMVGASGAISGVLAAAVVLKPRNRIMLVTPFTLFIPITLSLWTFGVLWMLMQVMGVFGADAMGGGVAFWAHIGGYIVGHWRTRAHGRHRAAHPRARAFYGPAPSHGYQTFTVTDSNGETYVFHETTR